MLSRRSARTAASIPPITPRKADLDYTDAESVFMWGENSVMSSMAVAFSAMFPPGEAEFIKSVRLFASRLSDDELREQVRLFAVQEGHHSLQHRLANEALDDLGYPATELSEQIAEEVKQWQNEASDEERLALTVVLEHVTAVMAHFALTRPETFSGLPQSVQTLVFWHAIEEIEHKSVAFDVYAECVGDRAMLRKTLVQQLVLFPYAVAAAQLLIHRQLRHVPRLDDLRNAAKFLFGRNGMIVGVLPHYFSFLKSDFHPWDIDDSALVNEWKERLSRAPFGGLTEIQSQASA